MINAAGNVPGDRDQSVLGVQNFEQAERRLALRHSTTRAPRCLDKLELATVPDANFFAPPHDEFRTVGQKGLEWHQVAFDLFRLDCLCEVLN